MIVRVRVALVLLAITIGGCRSPTSGDKSCVLMDDNGLLITRNCGLARPAICECDGVSNDATNY